MTDTRFPAKKEGQQPTATTASRSVEHPMQHPIRKELAVTRFVDGLVVGIARHWLALFNSAWGLYLLIPFLAPILMQAGYVAPARVLYSVYSFTCHQLPDHSYFLFGETLTPHLHELEAGGMEAGMGLLGQRTFIGNALSVGYKVAICQRDVAIYGGVFLVGILFALMRRRIPGLTFKWYLLFLIPIAIDGGTQLFGLRESNWMLRTVTGVLFGGASVWFAYPYIEDAMQDLLVTEYAKQKHI